MVETVTILTKRLTRKVEHLSKRQNQGGSIMDRGCFSKFEQGELELVNGKAN